MNWLEVAIRHKVYPGARQPALENLSFHAAEGEFVAVVGPSGAGKSTLLNILGGLDRALEGEVRLRGRPLHGNGAPPVRIGMMFQSPRLMPWLTALDNVRLVLGDDVESTALVRRLLQEVGLATAEGAFPGQLSGGMQRRVALARAFAVRPALLLLDEPFVSLDAPTAARLRRQLLALWAASRPTVMYVTHELREALAMADRVLFLSSGPGRVVLEHSIQLPRPRELEDRAVTELHGRLLVEHPDLLSGLTGGAADDGTPDGPGPVTGST